MFTSAEKKVIILLAALLLLGGLLRLSGFKRRYNSGYAYVGIKPVLKININTAGQKQLIRIPCIGPNTSRNIIQYRKIYGNFTVPADLKKVKGIGEKKLKIIKKFITFQ